MGGTNIGGREGNRRTHKRFNKIRPLVRCRWSEIPGYVRSVFGVGHGVLVLVGGTVIAGKGFGKPVRGADEGQFAVQVLSLEKG